IPTTASAPSTLPSGCAPTSSATPTKPTATPTSREPVTRTSWKATNAISALKIGTAAWMIDASPESIRVSPHERSQKGIAVLTSATTASQAALARSCRSVSRVPTAAGAISASVSAASPRRPTISVAGSSSRTATLMNRKRRAPDGGEAVFDEAYAGNCLVNAMCVGLLPSERVTRAHARGTGNAIVLYGATTGRDGIGGASVLASQELGEGSDEKRPSVQIGDPFTGKKLIEASLELVEGGLVESLQDCGAAGLASALAEMARDGAGVDVSLDLVPLREEAMEPWEIMVSESQERMVAVVEPERLAEVEAVLEKWELHRAVIGSGAETPQPCCF